MIAGAGGATAAFEHAGGRRIGEIAEVLGWRPFPGSLNVRLEVPFDWNDGYYRAEILDVVERGRGLDVEWRPRWARFYPVTIDGVDACAMRFEGERYPAELVELIAPWRLRDRLTSGTARVTIAR
jgi:CTP-dependent riboflavin kinase